MPLIVLGIEIAAFSYVLYHFGSRMMLRTVQPRAAALRHYQRLRSDLIGVMHRGGRQICLLGASALVAARVAAFALLWAIAGSGLVLLGLITLLVASQLRRRPDLLPGPRPELSEDDIARQIRRGHMISLTDAIILCLWIYAWSVGVWFA